MWSMCDYNDHGELELTERAQFDEYTGAFVGFVDQTEYDYDVFGNLRRVALPNGIEITYEIDPLGRRVRREENGAETQRLLWDGQLRPVAELTETGDIDTLYVYGTGINVPDYYERDGHTYRIITDHLGSPRMIVQTDSPGAGRIVFRRDYDPWGEIEDNEEITERDGEIPFGFAGGLYDEDTGLVRFGFRDYDPHIGRWTAKDPIGFGGGDTNWYAYVGNEPVGRVDPSGLIDDLGCLGQSLPHCTDHAGSAPWYQGFDWLTDGLVNGIAGVGNGITFGLAGWLRQGWPDVDAEVETECNEHALGNAVGQVTGVALGAGWLALRPFTAAIQTITHWTGSSAVLASGTIPSPAWVMTGGSSLRNWIFSGIFRRYSLSNAITQSVPSSALRWPSGWEWIKGFLGQRMYVP